jgi:glutathione synthase
MKKILFVMSPVPPEEVEFDTTCSLIREAGLRGHLCLQVNPGELYLRDNSPLALAGEVAIAPDHAAGIDEQKKLVRLDEFDLILMRREPPFDMNYLNDTLVLSFISNNVPVINNPRGLRDSNEKLYTLNFPGLCPPTLVTRDADMLKSFAREISSNIIVKPLDSYKGYDIEKIDPDDPESTLKIHKVTRDGSRLVMAQKFIPEVIKGDKRILMLNGEPLGAFNRLPPEGSFKANISAGGSEAKTGLTERDHEICDKIADRLREDGHFFVGIDVIGDYLTEINVTSPAGIPEINMFDNVKLECQVWDWLEIFIAGK